MQTTHNKLVRDKIPDILSARGIRLLSYSVDDEEMPNLLLAKFKEEIAELEAARSAEEVLGELADIYEILHAYAHFQGLGTDELEDAANEKWFERGGFGGRKYLVWTEEE